jgi:hypothetical protein
MHHFPRQRGLGERKAARTKPARRENLSADLFSSSISSAPSLSSTLLQEYHIFRDQELIAKLNE